MYNLSLSRVNLLFIFLIISFRFMQKQKYFLATFTHVQVVLNCCYRLDFLLLEKKIYCRFSLSSDDSGEKQWEIIYKCYYIYLNCLIFFRWLCIKGHTEINAASNLIVTIKCTIISF